MLNYEYPPLGGGAGRISQHISEELTTLGHPVTVITSWFDGLVEEEYLPNKPRIIRIKSKRKERFQSNPIEMYDWLNKAWEYLKQKPLSKDYDICFANFTIPGGWLAFKINHLFGLHYCIISHGHDIPWFFKKQMFFYHLFTYPLIKKFCRNADFIFVQSSYMKRNADAFVGKRKSSSVILIPNGITPQPVNFEIRKGTPLTILFAGRFVTQKNPLVFVKALHRVSKMQIPYQAYMIGDGKLRHKIERSIVKYKLSHVKLTGWIDNKDVWKYYERAHIMVMPSLMEGMSISNLEALSAGLFLITTPVSGNTELLSCCKNGKLVPLYNDRQIANAIQTFYFEQYLTKTFVSERYMDDFKAKFSWSNIATQYETVLKKMINK